MNDLKGCPLFVCLLVCLFVPFLFSVFPLLLLRYKQFNILKHYAGPCVSQRQTPRLHSLLLPHWLIPDIDWLGSQDIIIKDECSHEMNDTPNNTCIHAYLHTCLLAFTYMHASIHAYLRIHAYLPTPLTPPIYHWLLYPQMWHALACPSMHAWSVLLSLLRILSQKLPNRMCKPRVKRVRHWD